MDALPQLNANFRNSLTYDVSTCTKNGPKSAPYKAVSEALTLRWVCGLGLFYEIFYEKKAKRVFPN